MGVPKFFRYMSERYPCLSEFVKEYQLPTFDNLYLDMNGIIHMCSHPEDDNPHFRITEEKLFADIFHYIEVLFRMIKPQKVFFMAVDGVAPRAKMNQQRGRRFRSAKEGLKLEAEARKKGEKLPDVPRFDSNCITPGTEFMAKLHEQLQYFVVKKVSTDDSWRKCKVILSGHETPGEGEHKIMDYIRYLRAQPGYDPNTRHCLYGLDADLIMLGLCTHDPHFSLLREEVKFVKKQSRNHVPEEIRFYLLHLSLMREYLEIEFSQLKTKLDGKPFEFDIEKIIDDWILMGFLVGNDFIPHLPNLHINNGAWPKLINAYMDVLPTLDGYINESGTLNLERFEKFMVALGSMDREHYEEAMDNLAFMEMKTGRKQIAHFAVSTKGSSARPEKEGNSGKKLIPFFDNEDEIDNAGSFSNDPALDALKRNTEELFLDSADEEDSTSDEEAAFKVFKDEYYRNKLEYENVTPEVMRSQAEGYVTAIQWNLNYYYNGVCSWSWFYPHHYAPYISDIKDFANLKIEFELGQPFKPYEQLLAVLPSASKELLPRCYHGLMVDEDSLIKQYYPEDFQTDLNGKRQEWEAVVLVPFIDEKLLLEAMAPCNARLTPEEVKRNTHGPMLIYQFTEDSLGHYNAPNYFSTVVNHADCKPLYIEDLRVPKEKLVKGAYPGVKFDVFYPGFPTMKHLKYSAHLKSIRVRVFEQPSRNESYILSLDSNKEEDVPLNLLGQNVWVDWPHLIEAKVIGISCNENKYVYNENVPLKYDIEKADIALHKAQLDGVCHSYLTRLAIDCGETKYLIHVRKLIGRRYIITANGKVNLEKQFSDIVSFFPLQAIVKEITIHDDFHSTYRELTDLFPTGATCFTLSNPHYGSKGIVTDSTKTLPHGKLNISLTIVNEPVLADLKEIVSQANNEYYNLYQSAQQVAISNYVFSRVTGSLFILTQNAEGEYKSVNIGLDLKFNKKNQEVPGYTKKLGNTWHYSLKAIEVVKKYIKNFPQIFEFIAHNKDADDLNSAEIFGSDGSEKVKEIQTWLKILPIHSIKPRVCNSSVLDSEIIKRIETIVDEFNTKQTAKTIEMQIRPQLLYKPEVQNGNIPPDPYAKTKVFDRIVNVREGFTVPVGLKGTVIAIYQPQNAATDSDEMYEVVFDAPFEGGMTINCSENRAYRMPKTAFINISHGIREMEQKTGKPGHIRAQMKSNQNINNFRMNLPNMQGGNNHVPQNSAFAPVNMIPPMSAGPHNLFYRPQMPPTYMQPMRQNMNMNQVIKQQRYRQVTPLNNDFMPMFGPKTNNERQQETPKQKKVEQKKVVTPKTSQTDQKAKIQIDTDYLKKLLKIDDNNSKKGGPSASAPPVSAPPVFMPLAKPVIYTTKELFKDNTSCATAKLLSYYQANGFGCPRYTYLIVQNEFVAQIVSPTQKLIVGKPAFTRELASENAASAVIEMLQEIEKQGHAPEMFPEPPRNWVTQNPHPSNQNQPPKSYNNKNSQGILKREPKPPDNKRTYNHNNHYQQPQQQHQHHHHQNTQQKEITKSVSTSSFVPLQAIIKQGGKNQGHNQKNSNSSSSRNHQNQNRSNDKREDNKVLPKEGHKASEKLSQSKSSARKRQTRIAANFVGSKS